MNSNLSALNKVIATKNKSTSEIKPEWLDVPKYHEPKDYFVNPTAFKSSAFMVEVMNRESDDVGEVARNVAFEISRRVGKSRLDDILKEKRILMSTPLKKSSYFDLD